MDLSKTLIIIPTLLIPEILKVVPGVHILVVDDNSPDGTSQCVKELARTADTIFVLDRAKKEGLGRAYISGFAWALERGYAFVFEMDADFSHDPRYLPDFLRAIEDSDLVIGSRYISGVNVVNWPMSRLLLSYFGNVGARIIAGIPIRDCTGGFKCFRSEVLRKINLEKIGSSGYSFQVEMNYHVWRYKFRIKEIPIVFTDRQRGQSKMSSKIWQEALVLLWKLRFRSLIAGRR
jgi:dolichol-phosphate mannosyltransferase